MKESEISSLYTTFLGLLVQHDHTKARQVSASYHAARVTGAGTVEAILDAIEETYAAPPTEEIPFVHPDYRLIDVPAPVASALERLGEACNAFIEASNLVRVAEAAAGWDPTP